MKKVYYYNEKLNTVITKEDLLRFYKQDIPALKWVKPLIPNPFIPEELQSTVETEQCIYKISDIPFNPDWEVFVVDDNTLTEEELRTIVSFMYRGHYSSKDPVINKLTRRAEELIEFRHKGIKFE